HATLTDTALRCHEELVRPLTDEERETYYQEMTVVAERFGCPREAQPATYADFERYMDERLAAMEITPIGKELIAFILEPKLPLRLHVPLKPLLASRRCYTLGCLPAPTRAQLPVTWGAKEQARYEQVQRTVRRIFSLTPTPLRPLGPRLNGLYLLPLA